MCTKVEPSVENNQALWKVQSNETYSPQCELKLFSKLTTKTKSWCIKHQIQANLVQSLLQECTLAPSWRGASKVGRYYFGPVGQFPTESPNPSTSAKLHKKTEELKVKIMCQDITKLYKYQITKTFLWLNLLFVCFGDWWQHERTRFRFHLSWLLFEWSNNWW